jgi:hypothetical protein
MSRHEYTVGGLVIETNRQLGDLESDRWADGRASVRFADEVMQRVDAQGWIALDLQGVHGHARSDGSEAVLLDEDDGAVRRGWQVKQLVPFLAAMSGRVLLHAAGVRIGDRSYALVGASGRGKSTLATALSHQNIQVLADDLLPCRFFDGIPVGPHPQGRTPLTSVFFLDRFDDERSCQRLTSVEALADLAANGFGELAHGEIWAAQFAAYHRIAGQVPAYRLTIPDRLDRLDETVAWLLADPMAATP